MLKWILVTVLCLNSVSFTLYRIVWLNSLDGKSADLVCTTAADASSAEMTYLVAGNLNQPTAAFAFLEPELDGNVTYAPFGVCGWQAQATAEQILDDISEHGYTKVNVYTISLGDHVARYIEAGIDDSECSLQVYAINPCPTAEAVKQPLRGLLTASVVPFEGVCYALGWLSIIPVIPTPGDNYSLILLADQYWEIVFDDAPHDISHTVGVVCSYPTPDAVDDGILLNAVLQEYYQDVPVVMVETSHGDTIGQAEKYLQAIRVLQDTLH